MAFTCGSVFKGERVWEDLDGPYPTRNDVDNTSESHFRPRARKRLTVDRWHRAQDSKGRWEDIEGVLRHIRRGGIEPRVRGEVWEFLLGVFPANSTAEERKSLRKQRREAYAVLKEQCRDVDPIIGSGTVVDFPRIQEDGTPVKTPSQFAEFPELPHLPNGKVEQHGISINMHADKPLHTSEERGKADEIDHSTDPEPLTAATQPLTAYQAHASPPHKTNLIMSVKEGGVEAPVPSRDVEGQPLEPNSEAAEKAPLAAGTPPQTPVISNPELERQNKWRFSLHQIGVDVLRTDRTLEFYNKLENRARLMDILAVYAWLDPDVGYCQGMSDLVSPLAVLLGNEADAFWCFERLMRQVRSSFRGNVRAIGVQEQLDALSHVLHLVDPALHNHLEKAGAGSFFFAVRTVMVLFRREFSFADTLYLWEMMWAMDYDPEVASRQAKLDPPLDASWNPDVAGASITLGNAQSAAISGRRRPVGRYRRDTLRYGLLVEPIMPVTFCVAAMLVQLHKRLLHHAGALDEVMKTFNEAAKQLDLKQLCKDAVVLHRKYLALTSKKS